MAENMEEDGIDVRRGYDSLSVPVVPGLKYRSE
jgi:hypothetical protein